MTAPSLDLQRRVCRQRCESAGVPLFTPESPQPVREALAVIASLISPRSYAEVRASTSFYVPRLAGQLWGLLPDIIETPLRALGVDIRDTGAIYVAPAAWDLRPCSVVSHELSHANRDRAVSAGGAIVSSMWALGYLAHPSVRGWEEGTCKVSNLTAMVILEGLDVDDALHACADGAKAYGLDKTGENLYVAMLQSAAASLRAGQLPGVNTEVHLMAQMLVREGWDPGPWRAVIGVSP